MTGFGEPGPWTDGTFTGLPLIASPYVPPGQTILTAEAVLIAEDDVGPLSLVMDGHDPGEPVTVRQPSRWQRIVTAVGRTLDYRHLGAVP